MTFITYISQLYASAEGVEGEGSADSSTYTDTMDSPQRYSNPEGNRCQLRMLTEDEEADLAVAESAARRRGDVLGQEVTQLRQTIARLQLQHETELRAVKAGNEGMEAQFSSLNSEVTRLTTKVSSFCGFISLSSMIDWVLLSSPVQLTGFYRPLLYA